MGDDSDARGNFHERRRVFNVQHQRLTEIGKGRLADRTRRDLLPCALNPAMNLLRSAASDQGVADAGAGLLFEVERERV